MASRALVFLAAIAALIAGACSGGPSSPTAPLPASLPATSPTVASVAIGTASSEPALQAKPTPQPDKEAAPDPAPELGPFPPPQLAVASILAFGDSITLGFVSPAPAVINAVELQNAYPAKLQTGLRTRFTNQSVIVVNRGVGGELASEGRSRLLDEISGYRPDLVLLLEGINDLSLGLLVASLEGRSLSSGVISSIIADLRWMAQAALAQGVDVLLATLTPIGDERAAESPEARPAIAAINDQIRSLAASLGLGLVDLNRALSGGSGFIGRDDLHPTVAGYQFIAQTFGEAIVSRFERAPAVPTMTTFSRPDVAPFASPSATPSSRSDVGVP